MSPAPTTSWCPMDEEIDVTLCPDCNAKGRYDGRVLIGGRGIYTCGECGCQWQNANEKPSNKGVVITRQVQ